MIKIFITNLGKYNEGILMGEWLTLPASDEEIENLLERIGINEYYEEFFITDYESDIEGLEIGEFSDIYELNEISESLDNFDEDDLDAIGAYLENIENNLENAIKKVNDREFNIYYDCYDMADVAWEVVEQSGLLENVPEFLRNYFDYKAYGRDLNIEGYFFYIGSGKYIEFFM